MADFIPPSDLFHLGPVLDDIRSKLADLLSDRNILIANQDSQQTQLSEILAAQSAQVSAISSASAQLSANIAALGIAIIAKLDSLLAVVNALGSSLATQIDDFGSRLPELIDLLKSMIQAFQGVATLTVQNRELDLLGELIQATSPKRATSLSVDLQSAVTTPQPIPARAGP